MSWIGLRRIGVHKQESVFLVFAELLECLDEHINMLTLFVLTYVTYYELIQEISVLEFFSYGCLVHRLVYAGIHPVIYLASIWNLVLPHELLSEVRHRHYIALCFRNELTHLVLPFDVIPRKPMEPRDAST